MNMGNIKHFVKLELSGWNKTELSALVLVLCIIFSNAIFLHDSPIAIVYAICGILYTIIAGKGKISCYIFGLISSVLYSYISFKNAIYGNLFLNLFYYIPMQILGIFQWKKHLKKTTNEIYKTKLEKKELIQLSIISILACVGAVFILKNIQDGNPIIDGITTMLSIVGMYLTVKRCIEQWIVWTIVNGLSVIMWLNIALKGIHVYSTALMWFVYFLLGIYFYIQWNKEIRIGNIKTH